MTVTEPDAGAEMDVGVPEPREDHPMTEVDHLGRIADEAVGVLARPDEDDFAGLDGHGLGLLGRGHRVDGALEDDVGNGGLAGTPGDQQGREEDEQRTVHGITGRMRRDGVRGPDSTVNVAGRVSFDSVSSLPVWRLRPK